MSENEWTFENEVYCQHLGEQSSVYNWMNLQEETKYKKRVSYLNFFATCIAILAAFTTIVDSIWPSPQVKALNKALSITTAAVVKYNNSPKFRDLADLHKRVASEYLKLFDIIQYNLALPRQSREPAGKFIESARVKFIDLITNNPTISEGIIDVFNRKYKLSNITKPIVAGELEKISVSRSGDFQHSDERARILPSSSARVDVSSARFDSHELTVPHNYTPRSNWRRKLSKSFGERLHNATDRRGSIGFSYHDYANTPACNGKPTINSPPKNTPEIDAEIIRAHLAVTTSADFHESSSGSSGGYGSSSGNNSTGTTGIAGAISSSNMSIAGAATSIAGAATSIAGAATGAAGAASATSSTDPGFASRGGIHSFNSGLGVKSKTNSFSASSGSSNGVGGDLG